MEYKYIKFAEYKETIDWDPLTFRSGTMKVNEVKMKMYYQIVENKTTRRILIGKICRKYIIFFSPINIFFTFDYILNKRDLRTKRPGGIRNFRLALKDLSDYINDPEKRFFTVNHSISWTNPESFFAPEHSDIITSSDDIKEFMSDYIRQIRSMLGKHNQIGEDYESTTWGRTLLKEIRTLTKIFNEQYREDNTKEQ